MRPENAPLGTLVVSDVVVAVVTMDRVPLNEKRLAEGMLSKLMPVTLTEVPAAPMFGVKPVITGTFEPTVKGTLLAVVPDAVVTVINPVVAPAGTVVEICVALEEMTVATVPLNFTTFSEDVSLNAVP